MRDEEIVTLLEAKIKEEVDKIVSQGEKVEENDDFVVMKVSKKKIEEYGKK